MTGGGLLALTKYGAQNVILSGNPEMTYFYKVFKRYTHFSLESVSQQMDGSSSFSTDSPVTLSLKVPRVGDLVSDCYFSFQLPDIYSKFINLAAPPHGQEGRRNQLEFQWVRYVGCAAIQTVGFYIGGRLMQEFTGEQLMTLAQLDQDKDSFEKWRLLVGDTTDLYDPANSSFAGGSLHTGYPTVVPDYESPGVLRSPQSNRPSIQGKTIFVPLPFWFTQSVSQSLPLIALQYHICEIKLTLAPFKQLYTVLDKNGFRCAPGYQQTAPLTQVQLNQPEYGATAGDPTFLRNFLTDINTTIPDLDIFPMKPTIHFTYVYLPEEEQTIFASSPLTYSMRQYTLFPILNVFNRSLYQIDIHNTLTRLIFVPRRTDSLPYRNDFANTTNWYKGMYPAFLPPGGQPPIYQTTQSSGRLIPQGQPQIIRSLRILSDGIELQEEKSGAYYADVVPFRYLKGSPTIDLPIYTFELHSPTEQPAGSINSSVIKKFQLDLDLYPLAMNSSYLYNINVYIESLNWVVIESGMGDLKYAL